MTEIKHSPNTVHDPSKRHFLRMAGLFSIAAASAYVDYKLYGPLIGQYNTLRGTLSQSEDEFFEQYTEQISRTHIGCNLSPDYLLHIYPDADPHAITSLIKNGIQCSGTRLATRWKTAAEQGMAFHDPWIHATLDAGILDALSLGAKSTRWPETHTPNSVVLKLQKLNALPPFGAIIEAGTPFAWEILGYLHTYCGHLKDTFGSALQKIPWVNVENEWSNRAGELEYTFSEEQMIEEVSAVLSHMPHVGILLNTIGVGWEKASRLKSTINLASKMKERFPGTRFKIGLDHYQQFPIFEEIFTPLYHPDTITGLLLLGQIPDALDRIEEEHMPIQVSEEQGEAYGEADDKYPPGSPEHLRFMIKRCWDHFDTGGPFEINLWGIEQKIRKYTENPHGFFQDPTIRMLRKINEKSSSQLHH